MSIKKGVPLSTTTMPSEDIRVARALSLNTVDEFIDFISFFPSEAGELFSDTDFNRPGIRSMQMVATNTVSAQFEFRDLTVFDAEHGFGALAPTRELASRQAELYLDEVTDSPAAGEDSDQPEVFLKCHGPVRSQGARGTCVAHTVVAVAECELRSAAAPLDLSEQFVYWMCKLNDGAPNASGTWQRVAVPLVLQYGICAESEWPYNPQQTANENQGPPPPNAPDAAMALRGTTGVALDPGWVEAICGQLDDGHAVGISVPVYDNWRIAQLSGDIPMPAPNKPPKGGHAMCIVGYGFDDGYLGGGYFIVRNSWGTEWATASVFGAGHGTLPFTYVRKLGWEAFTLHGPLRS